METENPGSEIVARLGKITIRTARAADVPQMCGLLAGLFSIEKDFSPDVEKQAAGLMLLLLESPASCLIVAETSSLPSREAGPGNLHSPVVVGMCTVQKMVSTAEGGYSGLLEDLVVSGPYRGRGIGTRLLSHALEWCENQNISRVQLLADKGNERALEFYAARGWSGTNLICLRKNRV
ncbi:MAG: GNAT family N-acetyltransferase [Nitrospiraceae bacterium]|nr:GNAT family N-acetyltransferase [Nitrospiraceae bacterium]